MDREPIRNRGALRRSRHINRLPAVNVHHASRYSERIGLPLNTFITVNLTALGVAAAASTVFRKLLAQRFAPWLRRGSPQARLISPTYVWSIEAAGNVTAAHWLVHLPESLVSQFAMKLGAWLEGLSGEKVLHETVQMKPIYNLVGIRRYILKGVNPAWAEHLGVKAVDQGIVNGKRSGFSKNLGPTARKAGGYKPKRVPPKMSSV